MTLTVTGVETIEITDPKGLIDVNYTPTAQKPKPDPLDELRKGIVPAIGPKPQPTIPAPFNPFTPNMPVGPYTSPILNPIPLPGHVPAPTKALPWCQMFDDRWARGLRATFGQENTTGQVL